MDSSTASLLGNNGHGEEIRPYKIHVSSKYLDLTKKKLELTRLPHELLLPPAREWENGTPKSEIEPLIDYWLETYSWRAQETALNTTLAQFRTAIKIGDGNPLRIHFLHIRSTHADAIPLLLIPPFPLTNLSLPSSLWKPLLSPSNEDRAFHIIIPSIPGLGFSDAFTTLSSTNLSTSAEIFDTLMKRLGYSYYLASSTGSGIDSPAHIDYHLTRLLGENFSDSCLGVHLLAPPLAAPTFGRETWAWLKFGVARFFHARIWGYEASDWIALRESENTKKVVSKKGRVPWRSKEETSVLTKSKGIGYGVIGMVGLREPNTFAYALCDSPVGLLSLVASALRKSSPQHRLERQDIIDVTQLAWLPGPEAGMRFWAGAVSEVEELKVQPSRRSRVALTVFGNSSENGEGYVCPAWGDARHDVLFSQRVPGQAGLVAWERGDVVMQGVRRLAAAVEAVDPRLRIEELGEVVIDSVAEEPILEGLRREFEDEDNLQLDVESPDTIVASHFT